jgi:alpha-D-ribose 1-methylphosphonate 5-triphosphate synthase subunit PhnG
MNTNTHTQSDRQQWLSTLAKAPAAQLIDHWQALDINPEFSWIRAPETGTVMVQGRSGANGNPFNLGETTVTRCNLILEDKTVGYGYIQGRSKTAVKIVALCDALLQQNNKQIMDELVKPLSAAQQNQKDTTKRKAAATKVDFFTLVRGDD